MPAKNRIGFNDFPTIKPSVLAVRRVLTGMLFGAGLNLIPVNPALAQQPPAGRELPIVCAAGTCTGGVDHWVRPGDNAATQTVVGQEMHIIQHRLRELYNWASFDIADGHTVRFDQRQGSASVALNRILGTTNPETFINGNLEANGEVFVINQNGIVFGKDAVVNTHSLVASTHNVWDVDAVLAGSITDAIAEDTPQAAFESAIGAAGAIHTKAGASITSADGGRVLMFAPEVVNQGTINTPGGQTVLAGSHDKVYLAASNDADLRGLIVEVDTGGKVENLGEIIAERGNISLVGLAVRQSGTARATSAVNFNGSVRLAARHKAGPATIIDDGGQRVINSALLGTTPEPGDPLQEFGVILGKDSRTEVLPEVDNPEAVIDASPFRPSVIEVAGKTIELQENASIVAPAGNVDLSVVPGAIAGEVVIRAGASIDVSGTTSTLLPMSRNSGTIELRGNELADSPVQRNGVLRGQEVTFDTRKLQFVENDPGTTEDDQYLIPVGDVSAVIDGTRRTIEERSASGGSVNIFAQNLSMETGSKIDVSGGYVTYESGFLNSTIVLAEGRVFDIAEAPQDIVYDTVLPLVDVDYERWGVTEQFNVFGEGVQLGNFEPGYIEGADAGSITLNADSLELSGDLIGQREAGIFQREVPGVVLEGRPRFFNQLPLAGALTIGRIVTGLPFGPGSISVGDVEADTADFNISAQSLQAGGINRLNLVSQDEVIIGDLTLDVGGELRVSAGQAVRFDGLVNAPGAQIEATTLQPPGNRPSITVSADSDIDLSGRWINDSPTLNPTEPRTPLFIDGGSISLISAGDLILEAGSAIAADAGAHLGADNSLTGGRGGSITLITKAEEAELVETQLVLNAQLSAFGVSQGGELSLSGAQFVIGDAASADALGGVALSPDLFADQGFASISLTAESITANAESNLIRIEAGTELSVETLLLQPLDNFRLQETGSDIRLFFAPVAPALESQQASSLSLQTRRRFYNPGDSLTAGIVVEDGASIRVNAEGKVSLDADDRIIIAGSIEAPAGDIALQLTDAGDEIDFRAQGIWLTETGALSAEGQSQVFIDQDGRRQGDVLGGGTVSVMADRGFVVAAPGSRISVDGASDAVDIVSYDDFGFPSLSAERTKAAAGTITLIASEGVLPFGSLSGAGEDGGTGGLLRVALDLSRRAGNVNFAGGGLTAFPETERVVAFGESLDFDPDWMQFNTTDFLDSLRNPAIDASGNLNGSGADGLAVVRPDAVSQGGFSFLELGARQVFQELQSDGLSPFSEIPAEIRLSSSFDFSIDGAIRFDAPILSADDVSVSLDTPHFVLVSTNTSFRVSEDLLRNQFEPTGGAGQLTVQADTIDLVGFSSTRGFGFNGERNGPPISLNASGDIRLIGLPVPGLSLAQFPEIQGAFESVSDLHLSAQRIYPGSLSQFDITLRGEQARLEITSSGENTELPLSAAGKLTLRAQHIEQGGTVMAPFGSITLAGELRSGTGDNPRVFEHAQNTGSATARSALVNAGALTDSDYRLSKLDGDNFQIERLDDGATSVFSSGGADAFTTPVIDGFRVSIRRANEAQTGDSFLLSPGVEPLPGSVVLGAGSLTSASGAGLTVGLGDIVLENNWTVDINNVIRTFDEPRIFSSNPDAAQLAQRPFNDPDRPWTKSIDIIGGDVDLRSGAVLDVAGGGDLIAAEFRPGPGGKRDILFGDEQGSAFALVPTQSSQFAAIDPLRDFGDLRGSDLSPELPDQLLNNLALTVDIGEGSDLPAGRYAVMPKSFALLPGAYLATPQADTAGFQGADAGVRVDGSALVTARFALAGSEQQTRTSAIVLESREQVADRAEYLVRSANEFFADRAEGRGETAPQLPVDGGRVSVIAGEALNLQASLAANLSTGRSTQVDIAADDIRIVDAPSANPVGVELLAADLNNLGAESLLIGGRRRFAGSSLEVDISSNSVAVDGAVDLQLPELTLVALDEIRIESGASLNGTGEVSGVRDISFAPDAADNAKPRALVRVSGDEQVNLLGDGAPGGDILIEAGASLAADGSITLDATDSVIVEGALSSAGGDISFGTSRISIGQVPDGTPGLVLNSLDDLPASSLQLRSASTIDFYGAVPGNANLDLLVLDAEALRGFSTDALVIANSITLTNSAQRNIFVPNTGSGAISFESREFTLAGGIYDLGFDSVSIQSEQVFGASEGQIHVGGDLSVNSREIQMLGGSDTTLTVLGDANFSGLAGSSSGYESQGDLNFKSAASSVPLGGALQVDAESIRFNTMARAASGSLALNATAGTLVLGSEAVLDAASAIEVFDGYGLATPGGSIELASSSGDISLEAGAIIDIAGAAVLNARDAVINTGAPGTLKLTQTSGSSVANLGGSVLGGLWTPSESGLVMINAPALRDSIAGGNFDSTAAQLRSFGLAFSDDQLLDLVQIAPGANFALDTGALSSTLDSLVPQLVQAGIGGDIDIRVRDGDLSFDETLRATAFSLTADRGSIEAGGTLDVSGSAGGKVQLNAGNHILVSGVIDASGVQSGGSISLYSREAWVDLDSEARIELGAQADGLAVDSGLLRINVPRNPLTNLANENGGSVVPINAQIIGAQRIELIANTVYENKNNIVAGNTNAGNQIGIDFIRTDLNDFANQSLIANFADQLAPGPALDDVLHILPGVEIRSPSSGNTSLSLDTAWDFASSNWRFNGEAGQLSLRAAGDLQVNSDLSDGLAQRDNLRSILAFSFDPNEFDKIATLLTDESWGFDLVAGADLTSTSPGAVPGEVASADRARLNPDSDANLTISAGARIRTGTGDINLRTSGDIDYGDDVAAVYTLGRFAGYGNLVFDPVEAAVLGDFAADWAAFQLGFGFTYDPIITVRDDTFDAPFFFDLYMPGAVYGEDGGDISVYAGGNINGPGTDQLANDWLLTLGGTTSDISIGGTPDGQALPTLWASVPEAFRQNLGSLGGGDIDIRTGGDVTDFSVMLPSSGQQVGEGFHYAPFSQGFTAAGENEVRVLGGGNLQMDIGGDYLGGQILLGQGEGDISADGKIQALDGSDTDLILMLGDADLAVLAGEGLTLEAAYNFSVQRRPSLIDATGVPLDADTRPYFFTYESGNRLQLGTLSNDLLLENANTTGGPIVDDFLGGVTLSTGEQTALKVYPGTFSAHAFAGDIQVDRGFVTYPDPEGTLQLLAHGNVTDLGLETANARVAIIQSDTDPNNLPQVDSVQSETPLIASILAPLKTAPVSDVQRLWHAATPLHTGDFTPSRIVARTGTVGDAQLESAGFRLMAAEQTRVSAGASVIGLDIELQNNNDSDISTVIAGQDIIFQPNRNIRGQLAQSQNQRNEGILVTGPGVGVVAAGRNIDLGTSDGIVSVGDLRNLNLPENGADLNVLAGIGSGADLDAFTNDFILGVPSDDGAAVEYLRELFAARASLSGQVGEEVTVQIGQEALVDALADIRRYQQTLSDEFDLEPGLTVQDITLEDELAQRVLGFFFEELKGSGIQGEFARGLAAAQTLFPDEQGAGELSLLLSRIHTEDGGDISLYVPGGTANAGAATTDALTKSENRLGIVVQREGNVSGFVRDDFFVNASRVFALQGGNIVLWASTGDIDAGRGAKSALAAPPPQVVFDANSGQFVTVFPPEVSGSGIRNFAPPGVQPGDVFLFAPQGIVSAGDAGIASAGNITIVATEVVGADNIQVGGTSVGVPSADVGGLAAGLTGVSNAGNAASQGAQDSSADQAANAGAQDQFEQTTLSIITVEVLGFGS